MLLTWEQAELNSAQVRRALEAELENAEDVAESAGTALGDHDAGAAIAEQLQELQRQGSEDNLESIGEAITDLAEQLTETQIAAPIAGRVIWTVDTVTSIGEPIGQDVPILQIADTRDPFVQTVIEEQYVPDMVLGQPVVVMVGGEDFVGFIERIGLLAVTHPEGGIPTVELDISVEAEEIEVLPGSTALAELIVGELPDAVVLPGGPYLVTGNRACLYMVEGATAIRTPVTYGAVTERYVQIISGVSAGDEVITSSYQNYIDFASMDLEVVDD